MRRRRRRGERTLNAIGTELEEARTVKEWREQLLFRAIASFKRACADVRKLQRELDRAEALHVEDAEARAEEARVSAQQSD